MQVFYQKFFNSVGKQKSNKICLVLQIHLVLHLHEIAPTFLKLDSWSTGADFIPIISTKGNKADKERKILRKKISFMHTKIFNTFFKRWAQFLVGAIPRLPCLFTWWPSGHMAIAVSARLMTRSGQGNCSRSRITLRKYCTIRSSGSRPCSSSISSARNPS